MVGIELPVLAMEHHYLITEDIPELAGREREIVNTTDYAGEIYMRQERGGALIGTYEPHGVVWSPLKTPTDFSMQLLPDDFERLAPYFEVGLPAFPGARARRHQQGDQRPVHLRAGRQSAGRAGARAAQLLGGVRGDGRLQPGRRHRPGAVALDGAQTIRARTSCRWTSRASARSPRRSTPSHQGAGELRAALPPGLSERGAAGRAAGAPLADLRSAARRRRGHGRELRTRARAVVRAGGRRARRDADLSALGGLPGRARGVPGGARARSACTRPRITASTRSPAAARARGSTGCSPAAYPGRGGSALAPMLNPAGRIVGDLSIACLAEDRFFIVGSGFAEEFHLRWFCGTAPPADVYVRSAASTLVRRVDRRSAGRASWCSAWCAATCPRPRSSCSRCGETAVGFAPAILTRAGFTGELGYEIWTTPDYFADAVR